MCRALAKEVSQSPSVHEVHCWKCWDRQRFCDDCVICGGKGSIDVEKHREVIHEDLSDAFRGKRLPGWFKPGVYSFADDSDAYLVRGNLEVLLLTEEVMDEAWAIERPRASMFDWLLGLIIPGVRGAA